MAREPKYGVTINGWERLLVAFAANAGDLPHLDEYRVQLERAIDQLREAAAQQAALRAGKQEASRRVQSLLVNGRKVANFPAPRRPPALRRQLGEAGRVRPAAVPRSASYAGGGAGAEAGAGNRAAGRRRVVGAVLARS